jgi:hypothetical protein
MLQVLLHRLLAVLFFVNESSGAALHGKVELIVDTSGHVLIRNAQHNEWAAHAKVRPSSQANSSSVVVTTSSGALKCLHPFKSGEMDPNEACPEECPFIAQMATPCEFQCVGRHECAAINHEAPIADPEEMTCRGCQVEACEECVNNGEDACKTCAVGYDMKANGTCEGHGKRGWVVLMVIVGVVAFAFLIWVLELLCRPAINDNLVEHGLRHRWRSRLFNYEAIKKARSFRSSAETALPAPDGANTTETAQDAGRGPPMTQQGTIDDPFTPSNSKLWPLTTNLCRTSVAGPGLLLYFNFEFMILIWVTMVMFGWSATAITFSYDLFKLGIQKADTARQLCDVVLWGTKLQRELMTVKVGFMVGLYLFSVCMFLLHAMLQERRFHEDDDNTTLEDFAALAERLPAFHGSELAEDRLKQSVEAATNQKVVGVSVCWNYTKREDDVMKVLQYEMRQLADAVSPTHRQGDGQLAFPTDAQAA